jgi:hypothetical protein
LEPSEDTNNSDDNVNEDNLLNDLSELINDEFSISRPFNILTQSQNDPSKSAMSKANFREMKENIVLQKSLTVLDKLATNKRKHSEELDADETFGMHVAHSLRQIEDRCTKELLKLKIQQLLFKR